MAPTAEQHWRPSKAEVAWVARLQERSVGLVAGAMGAVLALLVMSVVSSVARPDSFTQRMFHPGGVLNSIPWAITLLFTWSVCVLGLRRLRLGAQRRQLGSPLASEVRRLVAGGDPGGALQRLKGRTQDSLLLTRVERLLGQWQASRSLERAESAAQREVDMDYEAVGAGYSIVRTFVWAMPILGFIGTVIGISLAVGEFSSFLGGEIGNLDAVKKQLMVVTHGLSFAFLTTLHGLLGALFAMLPAAGLQRAEEDFLVELDRWCEDEVISRLQSAPAAASQTTVTRDVISGLAEALEKRLPDLTAWREQMDAYTLAALDRMGAGWTQMSAQLKEASREESDRLREMAIQIGASFVDVGKQLADEFAATQRRLSQGAAEHVAALDQQGAAFQQSAQRLVELHSQTEQLVALQTALNAALEQMRHGDSLGKTMLGVQESLESLRLLLGRLSGPFELRLAPPAPGAAPAGGGQ